MLVVCAVVTLGLAACGGGDDEDGGTTAAAAEEASVRFIEPTEGATTGSTLTAVVEVSGFEVDGALRGEPNKEGTGHLHFSLDGSLDHYAKTFRSGPKDRYRKTYIDLPRGEHTLGVDLVNNDHTKTGTSATTTFEVTTSGSSGSPSN